MVTKSDLRAARRRAFHEARLSRVATGRGRWMALLGWLMAEYRKAGTAARDHAVNRVAELAYDLNGRSVERDTE